MGVSMPTPKLSFPHVWFLLFNCGTLAVIICVLSGCRSPTEAKYSLLTTTRDDVVNFMDSNCTSCTFDNLPDRYGLGLSGVCRYRDGKVDCEKQFPNPFNLTQAIELDMVPSNTSANEGPAVAHAKPIDYALVHRLSKAVAGLLIVSTLISFGLIPLSLASNKGFNKVILVVAGLDACILLSGGLMMQNILSRQTLGVFPDEAFENPGGWKMTRSIEFLGVGAWLLLAGFISRLLSHPLLMMGFLAICLAVVLIPVALVSACLCSGFTADTTSALTEVYYVFV